MALSSHIVKHFSEERKSPLHDALLKVCLDKLKGSREYMGRHYDDWDKMHETYMHRRAPDKNDVEAVRAGLPRKIVLPLATSQVLTGVAFSYMLLNQRENFYEFKGTDDSDRALNEVCTMSVQSDLNYNNHKQLQMQSLLNLFRFGMFCEVDSWETEYEYIPIDTVEQPPRYMGQPVGDETVVTKVEKVVTREGNRIRSISPYRVFPDSNFHLSDWKEGTFIAWDDSYSREALWSMEQNGDVVGTEHIQKYTVERLHTYGRSKSRISGIDLQNPQKSDVVCVTTMVVRLTPSQIKGNDGTKLSDEQYCHRWLVWIANDDRIIRAEPLPNLHAQYPVSLGMFLPDQHECVLNSLSRLANDFQGLVSWLLNSRMAAVSRTIEPQAIVDPMGINMDDLNARARLLRLRKEAGGKDVRRYYMPLEVRDTTQGHVGDMNNLIQLMQMVTGVNDNALGQVAAGRRSATENRAANSGAASRLKMVLDVVWGMAYQPQANRLLTNHRQSATMESLATIVGEQRAMEVFEAFKSEPRKLARSYDFVTYDGSLPSEKLFLAQQLQELLALLIGNPLAAAGFNMDPNKVQKEIMELRGLGRGGQYAFDQVPQGLIAALQMQHGTPEQQPAPTPPQ